MHLHTTMHYPCSYLPGRQARAQIALPLEALDGGSYSLLIRQGFRRNGNLAYRPHCKACQACVPVRIPVAQFVPNRTQARTARRYRNHPNYQLRAQIYAFGRPHPDKHRDAPFEDAHYALYTRYQIRRHAESAAGDDASSSPGEDGRVGRQQYADFILQSPVESLLVAFHRVYDQKLKMVCLIDRVDDGLSAVYTFYDPDEPHASYGTYGALWQIEHAHTLGLPYLYLGYWIANCRKMRYKTRFQPLEYWQGSWCGAGSASIIRTRMSVG